MRKNFEVGINKKELNEVLNSKYKVITDLENILIKTLAQFNKDKSLLTSNDKLIELKKDFRNYNKTITTDGMFQRLLKGKTVEYMKDNDWDSTYKITLLNYPLSDDEINYYYDIHRYARNGELFLEFFDQIPLHNGKYLIKECWSINL